MSIKWIRRLVSFITGNKDLKAVNISYTLLAVGYIFG